MSAAGAPADASGSPFSSGGAAASVGARRKLSFTEGAGSSSTVVRDSTVAHAKAPACANTEMSTVA